MNKADKYYIDNLKNILTNGCVDESPRSKYKDGTPAFTKYITQVFEKYDISKGEFPIPTLRNTAIKTGIKEIQWIYQLQSNDLSVARTMGINWWDEWDIGDDTIGNRYGYTIRKYKLMDGLLEGLEKSPFGRRHIINMFQYEDLNSSDGLFPCAFETMWSVRRVNWDMYLDMHLNQRSNDYIMAGAINKIQYVALQMMVAGHLGYKVGTFSHYVDNLHVYDRHLEAAMEILYRKPKQFFPSISLPERKNFYDYTIDDFKFRNINGEKLTSPLEIAI